MKLGLHFRDALQGVSPWLVHELDQLVDAIRTSYLIEHDADGRFRQTHVRAELLTAQTLSTEVLTRVLVGRPARTTGTIDLDTASGIVTIRVPGIYLVIGQARFASNTTGRRTVELYQGLAQVGKTQLMTVTDGGTVPVLQACATVPCTRGETLLMKAAHASGGNLDIDVADTFFSVTRVG